MTNRNSGLDILKFICCFLIIFIHAPFPSEAGKYFCALCRIAVPIFLMITGFFYDNIRKNNKEKAQIKKIFKLLIFSNILYFCYSFLLSLVKNELNYFLVKSFSIKSLLKFLFLNESPFGMHLWYLGAILYVLILNLIIEKKLKCGRKIFYFATPILLIIDLIFGKYSILLLGQEFPYTLVRNFMFVGIPYFSIGMYIKEKSEKLKSINNKKIILSILLFSCLTILERIILVQNGFNAARDHYISTTFLSISVFLYFVSNDWNNNFIKNIGKNFSTMIYIIHPIIIGVFTYFFKLIGLNSIYQYFFAILVFVVSIISARIINMFGKKINNMRMFYKN